LVEDILEDAATVPSGANIQPWRVYVGNEAVKDEFADTMLAASRAGIAPAPAHFPDPLPEVFRARLQDFGARCGIAVRGARRFKRKMTELGGQVVPVADAFA
jgi:nitroreductase